MDLKTFEKELKKALRKPQDWTLASGFLMHRKTCVKMLAEAIQEGSLGVVVFDHNGSEIFTINSGVALQCLHSVRERAREERNRQKEMCRDRFLTNFRGFE